MIDRTQIEAQTRKAARYYERVLREANAAVIAVETGGVMFLVATGSKQDALRTLIEREGIARIDFDPETPLLVPRWHQPPPEHAHSAGRIHLHVTRDMQIGRRSRKEGECLCSKKRGSNEQPPREGAEVCSECSKLAQEHGLRWAR